MAKTEAITSGDEMSTRDAVGVEPIARFVEQMGLICEADNLPRIAGRLFGLLIVEDGAYSLRQLADRLQVSRASVSTNARILTEIGIVERAPKPGDRQGYYQLASNPFHRMLTGKVRALQHAQTVFSEAAESFPAKRETAKRRLREMAEFHRTAAEIVSELIERSSQQRH